jgi:hypothetical protein
MAVDYHALTEVSSAGYGLPQATTDIVSNTDKRDVSEVLDLFTASETPFIERIGWGPECSATKIEWLYENLGPGYVAVSAAVTSSAVAFVVASADGLATAASLAQIQTGTVLYTHDAANNLHCQMLVTTITNGSNSAAITYELMSSPLNAATTIDIAANQKIYILGAAANEGSLPRTGPWRSRAIASNSFSILREDVQITGSQKATDFYAIGKEEQHQIKMRMLELVRAREKQALLAGYVGARSSTAASVMNGALGFLIGQSGSHINTSTTSLTESAVNDVVASCWEHGATNLTWFSSLTQARKFTQWDVNRIRMEPRDTRGGGHVTNYMTEAGVEMEIVALKFFPVNVALIIDTSKCRMRAKSGRKGIMEKLGKMGDFERWQIISEFSMEMRKYNQGAHGLFTALS